MGRGVGYGPIGRESTAPTEIEGSKPLATSPGNSRFVRSSCSWPGKLSGAGSTSRCSWESGFRVAQVGPGSGVGVVGVEVVGEDRPAGVDSCAGEAFESPRVQWTLGVPGSGCWPGC
jgi:hypothetical protein